MLFKFLGDKKVAIAIWQHGLPSIAEERPRTKVSMAMLQSRLDQCLRWYIDLANDIVSHQTQEGIDAARAASSKDEQERQQQQKRREDLQKAQSAFKLGQALARQRDHGKRKLEDMDEDEQKLLNDYDTGRAQAKKQAKTTKKLKPFRCQLGSTDEDATDVISISSEASAEQ